MLQRKSIPLLVLVSILGLLSCEKHEKEPTCPGQKEEYIEEQHLTVTTKHGTDHADNGEITLFEKESGKLSLVYNNNNRNVVFKDINHSFEKDTELTPPDVIQKDTATTINIYFTGCSEGFVTYNLKDIRSSKMYRYTYFIHTKVETNTQDETPEEENDTEEENKEEQKEEEIIPPLHLTIENDKYILKNKPLNIKLECDQDIDTLVITHAFSILVDNSEVQYGTNKKGENIVFTCSSIPQEAGRHEIKVIAIPFDETIQTTVTESAYHIVEPEHHWFIDRELTSEIYSFHHIFNTEDDTSTWLKAEIHGADNAKPSFSVYDITDNKYLKNYENGLFLLNSPSRGEHKFNIRYTLENFVVETTDTKIVKDEYKCTLSIDENRIQAKTSGPHGITADFSTNFTIQAVIRAVIPYTEARDDSTWDAYEYVNFQWVKTSFRQNAGTYFGTYTLQEGWINTALNWAKGKMSDVSVRQNGASRWVTKNGIEYIEYYTPVPYLQVAIYFEYDNSEGKALEYAIWYFDCSDGQKWLEDNGISLAAYLIKNE